MRTSLGQYRQSLEHGHGLVITVMVATPDAVRRGFILSRRRSASSVAASTSHVAQRWGSLRLTPR